MAQTRYLPYGEERWTADGAQPTDFTFTGQRAEGFGLMDYQARFYDPRLGRFASADMIVPEYENPQSGDFENPQSLNRYSYTFGNPLKYNDPTGNRVDCGWDCHSQSAGRPDPPPPPEPPKPQEGPPPDDGLWRPWEWYEADAGGIRMNASGGIIGGVTGNVDIITNWRSEQTSLFLSPGLIAGALIGGDFTVGAIEVTNLPNNDAYKGWAVAGGITAAVSELGGTVEWSVVPGRGTLAEETQAWYAGYSIGAELAAYVSPTFAIEVVRYSPQEGFRIFPRRDP